MPNIFFQPELQHNTVFDRHCERDLGASGFKKGMYVHRGYMGLASELHANGRWRQILQEEQPELYDRCDLIFKRHGNYTNKCCKALMTAMEYSPVLAAMGRSLSEEPPVMEIDLWLDHDEPWNLDKARFIHGNNKALAATRLGMGRNIVEKAVLGSNVHKALPASKWLDIFSSSLRRAVEVPGEFEEGAFHPSRHISGICFDIKSTYSSAGDVASFISSFKEHAEIDISYIGTFDPAQLEELPEGTKPLLFFHSYHEIMKHRGSHSDILFNGGELITELKDGTIRVNKKAVKELKALVACNKGLNIGIYTQERDASRAAIEALFSLIDNNPDVFPLGFVYGNLEGIAHELTVGDGKASQSFFMNSNLKENAKKDFRYFLLFRLLNKALKKSSRERKSLFIVLDYIYSQSAEWKKDRGIKKEDLKYIEIILKKDKNPDISKKERLKIEAQAFKMVTNLRDRVKKISRIQKLSIVIKGIALMAIFSFAVLLVVSTPLIFNASMCVVLAEMVVVSAKRLYECKVVYFSINALRDAIDQSVEVVGNFSVTHKFSAI